MVLTEQVEQDLLLSGLRGADLNIRALTNAERASTSLSAHIEGYVIPYLNIDGGPTPFYRVRTFNHDPKYKQVRATPNHIFFPKGVKELAKDRGYLIITEGEKKASCAVKHGFPTIALSGTDSWRNRTLILPEGTKLQQVPGKANNLSIKMEDIESGLSIDDSSLATGMQNVIDLVCSEDLTILICFDTDGPGIKFEVQRAAAALGFELRYRGVPAQQIKQFFLPSKGTNGHAEPVKVAVDDYLLSEGPEQFQELITKALENRKGFPQHPNIMDFVTKKLSITKHSRKQTQQLALAILADLDTRGSRMRSKETGDMYFFEGKSKTLIPVTLKRNISDLMQDTQFSRYLFRTYGISQNDPKAISWLATYFTTEDPIGETSPKRITHVRGDAIYHQLNDGQYVKVTGDKNQPFTVCDNGTDNVLFESGGVESIDGKEFAQELEAQIKKPLEPLWPKVIKELRLHEKEHTPKFLGLFYYMAPWLQRWRGSQLPVEMSIGEAGSGKSSIYELRLSIQTGNPSLRNAPREIRDWYASIVNSGGLHVIDNLHAIDRQTKAILSDELCRLVTEPKPHIEMRQLYTTAGQFTLEVNPTFAFSAVAQPFHNADLMQRSVVIQYDKGEEEVAFVSNWATKHVNQVGGRTVWLAHQMHVLHKFLQLCQTEWNDRYPAKHRLVHFEQSLTIMAKLFGMETDWIAPYLQKGTSDNVRIADWAFEGICEFAKYWESNRKGEKFEVNDISAWSTDNPEYAQCHQLTNSRSLGRYIQSHKQMLATIAKIRESGKYGNAFKYHIETPTDRAGYKGNTRMR